MSHNNQDNQEKQKQNSFVDVENGPLPMAQRSCTDIICCLLFLVNIVALIYLSIYAYTNSTNQNIYRATDQNKDICGQKGTATQNYTYSYFYNPLTLDLSNRLCVSSCPTFVSGSLSALGCYTIAAQPSCSYNDTVTSDGKWKSGSTPTSTSVVLGYDSYQVLGRICMPQLIVLQSVFANASTSISSGIQQSGISNFITDLQNNWKILLGALGLSVIISFIFMFLLRCIAGCVVWLSLILIVLGTVAMGIIFLYNGGAISGGFLGNLGIPSLPAMQYYNVFGYIAFGVAAVFLLLICCCCSRIRLAVAVCSVAGQFVARVCQVILVPIILTACIFALWVGGVIAMVGLVGSASFQVNGNDVFTSIASYADKNLVMLYYFFFGVLWSNAFIQALGIFIVASCCAMWYYSHGPGDVLDSPVIKSTWMAFRYHFGSLAFGALIIAIIQFLQAVVQVFKRNAEQTQNKCVEVVLTCVQCCLACVERIVQFLNRTAFIQIAICGLNFCNASMRGFEIIMSNGLRYTIVSGVGEILMFIGKLLIAGLTTLAFYLVITFVKYFKTQVTEPIYLCILVFIATYCVGVVFMSVYSIAMETILACFIIDQKNHGNKAHFAPEELREIMESQQNK